MLSAMSYALDLTEGQPQGHAARSCLLGMRIAEQLRLSPAQRSDLFYALLMKDAGCSSNAARVSQLFGGNDQDAIPADESRLDRIAHAFALVVDAVGVHLPALRPRGGDFGLDRGGSGPPAPGRVRLGRAAPLRDIGKLSVPNRILDKPGTLDAEEWDVVRRHPSFTYEILARVSSMRCPPPAPTEARCRSSRS